jgi:hypothetical protein
MPVWHQICQIELARAIFFCNTCVAANPRTIENDMSEGTEWPKRRGRPALPPEKGKRYAIGIRTTKELRDLLQKAADSSGRSLAQEIEFRLERSFGDSQHLFLGLEAAFGRELAALTLLLGIAMKRTRDFVEPLIGRRRERPWPFRASRGSGMTTAEITDLLQYAQHTMPRSKRRGIADPFVFDQVAKSVAMMLDALRPEDDPTVPLPPKSKDPRVIAMIMEHAATFGVMEACDDLMDPDQHDNPVFDIVRYWLGAAAFSRLVARLQEEQDSGASGGQMK